MKYLVVLLALVGLRLAWHAVVLFSLWYDERRRRRLNLGPPGSGSLGCIFLAFPELLLLGLIERFLTGDDNVTKNP